MDPLLSIMATHGQKKKGKSLQIAHVCTLLTKRVLETLPRWLR